MLKKEKVDKKQDCCWKIKKSLLHLSIRVKRYIKLKASKQRELAYFKRKLSKILRIKKDVLHFLSQYIQKWV